MKCARITVFSFLFRFSYVETALINNTFTEIEHLDEIVKDFGDVACFALQLIAKLCSETERHDMAAEANTRALKLNPFLWQPFADLCNHGHKPNPNTIYQFDNIDLFATCQDNQHNGNSLVWFGSDHDGTMTELTSDLIINNSSNNAYNIYTTPVPDQQQQQQQYCNILINNINSGSPTFTRMTNDADKSMVSATATATTIPASNLATPLVCNNSLSTSTDSDGATQTVAATPLRRQFQYLSNISPSTPSFGWLPINSPTESTNKYSSPTQLLSNQQQQQSLAEANDQTKSTNKKLKGNTGNLANRKETPLQISKPIFSQTGNITPRTQNTIGLGGQNVRRSSRLFSNNYSVKENNKSPIINKFAAPRSPPRKSKQRLTKNNLANTALNEINNDKQSKNISAEKEKIETVTSATSDNAKVLINNSINNAQNMAQHILNMKKQSAEGLMKLMRAVGQGYVHLSQYECKEAIECFNNVPKHHFQSSWVQSMVAKAHYEQRDYETSSNMFQQIHQSEPHRLHLMEIYSSVLWHLQREVTLSALAQDLMAQDKLSPITWCISGNCFSLHKEHETAIKFFERAVQVDPDFAYSYTLLGHELVITEELEKAMSCFRTAVLKDPRHYNAWYGMGSIYSKQERYSLAEFNFKHALKINPHNSVIMVHIGAMQFNLNKTEQALQTLNAAIQLDPKNPLCKFHRGSIYFQCGRYQEALKELEQLKQIVPKESVVYYIIGKIHKKLGNIDLALMNFSWATDLDPKGANNQVKDAFDSNTNQSASVPLNVTQDATEEASERSDDSTQLRGGSGDVDPDADGYESDSY